MIRVTSSGSFKKTIFFLELMQGVRLFNILDRYGRQGVDALSRATPRESGETANSWEYQVSHSKGRHTVSWFNTHREHDVNIAVILQYGHGTGTGGYVEGRDYINPVIQPLFDRMANDFWKEVTNA